MGIQSVPWPRRHGRRRIHGRLFCVGLSTLAVAACDRQAPDKRAEQPRPQQAGQPVNPVKLAAHLHAARIAAVTGNNKAAESHIQADASNITRSARMPDPHRPIDHEAARAAVRPIEGVRTSLWLDRENFVVMVGAQQHRSMEMNDQVCVALEPLDDTLAGVVNVKDVAAKYAHEAGRRGRAIADCRGGERAFVQNKRHGDVVAPDVRKQFKEMQRESGANAGMEVHTDASSKPPVPVCLSQGARNVGCS